MQLTDLCFKKAKFSTVQRQYFLIKYLFTQKKFTTICFAVWYGTLNNRGPKHAAANMLTCFFLPFALDYTLC